MRNVSLCLLAGLSWVYPVITLAQVESRIDQLWLHSDPNQWQASIPLSPWDSPHQLARWHELDISCLTPVQQILYTRAVTPPQLVVIPGTRNCEIERGTGRWLISHQQAQLSYNDVSALQIRPLFDHQEISHRILPDSLDYKSDVELHYHGVAALYDDSNWLVNADVCQELAQRFSMMTTYFLRFLPGEFDALLADEQRHRCPINFGLLTLNAEDAERAIMQMLGSM
ncbi:hypothetical protein [Aliagarivorans taiwanensis]|uniref:hypothetical protein n=1 Tax=Aliagarivorans taiwanensis TaxID=561966 RepID=UPI00047DB045|nr:hypothetical protein [Aliagarivorans taiwanensis]